MVSDGVRVCIWVQTCSNQTNTATPPLIYTANPKCSCVLLHRDVVICCSIQPNRIITVLYIYTPLSNNNVDAKHVVVVVVVVVVVSELDQ